MTVVECVVLDLPTISDARGLLTVVERGGPLPFAVERIFWVYGLTEGVARGSHAHHTLEEFVVCVGGALEVEVDDGRERQTLRLDRPSAGLYLPPRVWRTLRALSAETIYVVLASGPYAEADYIRDYSAYLAAGAS